ALLEHLDHAMTIADLQAGQHRRDELEESEELRKANQSNPQNPSSPIKANKGSQSEPASTSEPPAPSSEPTQPTQPAVIENVNFTSPASAPDPTDATAVIRLPAEPKGKNQKKQISQNI
ncbi:MAG TPA: hypothetical protein VGN61_10190, partial [Verrucomicrobiae bacterium]